jgi:hypothetical protein
MQHLRDDSAWSGSAVDMDMDMDMDVEREPSAN